MLKQENIQQSVFSQTMAHNLSILRMNKISLNILVSEISDHNPVISSENNFVPWRNSSLPIMPDIVEQIIQQEKTLFNVLREELIFDIDEQDYPLLYLIIGNLDKNGFLPISSRKLCLDTSFDPDRVEFIRTKIMNSSYCGLAALDSSEYLLFVTENKFGNNSLEYKIAEYLTTYRKKFIAASKLATIFKEPIQHIEHSLQKLKSISASPLSFDQLNVCPDFIVEVENQNIRITPLNFLTPSIHINTQNIGNTYSSDEIKHFVKEAKTLQQALNRRTEGLQKHAEALILSRSDYFLNNSSLQHSIGLKEIAALTNRHVSTVSRALKDRYFLFNQQIINFSELWTHKISKTNSSEIKKMIHSLVDKEDPNNPLSDALITNILNKQGIQISRRTIAKYREKLNIGTIYQRNRQKITIMNKELL
ncbi:MAG: hypothetical protein ACRCTQ_00425 [Brevinemataceae bacterium]